MQILKRNTVAPADPPSGGVLSGGGYGRWLRALVRVSGGRLILRAGARVQGSGNGSSFKRSSKISSR
jgi:hypothetical protein